MANYCRQRFYRFRIAALNAFIASFLFLAGLFIANLSSKDCITSEVRIRKYKFQDEMRVINKFDRTFIILIYSYGHSP